MATGIATEKTAELVLAALTAVETTFGQETAAATAVDGTTWKDLLDKSTLTSVTEIFAMTLTVAGGWAGNAKVRIVDGVGTTKIWPCGDEIVQGTDFTSGTRLLLEWPCIASTASGYKVQFRSSNAADGAGKTLALTLDKIARG